MRFFIAYLFICLTQLDLYNAQCDVLCKRDGYENGTLKASKCLCIESKGTIDDFVNRRVSGVPRSNGSLLVNVPEKKIETKSQYQYLGDDEY